MQCFVFLETSAFETCSGYIDFYVKQKVNQIICLNLSCIPLITPIFCIKVGLNGTKLHRCVMLMLTKPSATINEMTALELQRGFVTWCESYPT